MKPPAPVTSTLMPPSFTIVECSPAPVLSNISEGLGNRREGHPELRGRPGPPGTLTGRLKSPPSRASAVREERRREM